MSKFQEFLTQSIGEQTREELLQIILPGEALASFEELANALENLSGLGSSGRASQVMQFLESLDTADKDHSEISKAIFKSKIPNLTRYAESGAERLMNLFEGLDLNHPIQLGIVQSAFENEFTLVCLLGGSPTEAGGEFVAPNRPDAQDERVMKFIEGLDISKSGQLNLARTIFTHEDSLARAGLGERVETIKQKLAAQKSGYGHSEIPDEKKYYRDGRLPKIARHSRLGL